MRAHPLELDIAVARIEAALNYKRLQDEMDTHLRVTAVAFGMLGRVVSGDKGDRVLGALYGSMGDRTRPQARVHEPEIVVSRALKKGVMLAIASIQTDFEVACRHLVADAYEFWPEVGELQREIKRPGPAPHRLGKRGWLGSVTEALRPKSAGESFLLGCYQMLGLKPAAGSMKALPIFEYFRRCRNRVIHQDGTAGSDLAEFSRSEDLRRAMANLTPSVRRMTSGPPELEADEKITLAPSHAVLHLIVARTLFNELAECLRAKVDDSGFIRMAAHYAYKSAHHIVEGKVYKRPEQAAEYYLKVRYKLRFPHNYELIQVLRQMGLWEPIVQRFHELQRIA